MNKLFVHNNNSNIAIVQNFAHHPILMTQANVPPSCRSYRHKLLAAAVILHFYKHLYKKSREDLNQGIAVAMLPIFLVQPSNPPYLLNFIKLIWNILSTMKITIVQEPQS